MTHRCIAFAAASVFLMSAPSASAAPPQSATETQAIERIAESFFEGVRGGKTLPTVRGFFGSNSLMSGKTAELQNVANQIDGTITIYGPMGNCELVEQDPRGTIAENRLYVCAHHRYATRWILLFVKGSSGWQGANLRFDDKIAQHLGD